MTSKRPRRLFASLALSAGALLAPPSTLAQDVIRIGAPLALTGGLADEGKKQQAGYELWLERINAAGGITLGGSKRKVELVFYDYQTDEKRAQQLAERLITVDKVHVMTAPFGSGHTKVVAGVAERYGIPIVAVASAEPVHNQGYKTLFGTLAPSVGLIDAMIGLMRDKQPGVKRVAVLGRADVFHRVQHRRLGGDVHQPREGQVALDLERAVGVVPHLGLVGFDATQVLGRLFRVEGGEREGIALLLEVGQLLGAQVLGHEGAPRLTWLSPPAAAWPAACRPAAAPSACRPGSG